MAREDAAPAAQGLLSTIRFDAIETAAFAAGFATSSRSSAGTRWRAVRAPAIHSPANGGDRTRGGVSASARAIATNTDGDFRQDEDRRSARPADVRRRDDAGMEKRVSSRLPAPHQGSRRLDRAPIFPEPTPAACGARSTVFAGPVGKDVVSRTWRKVKGDWEAWSKRALADEPIVRLILDGRSLRVRLDKKATSISLLVALGVRANSQKVLLAVKNMGGESEAAWRACSTISSRAA